MTEAGTKRQSEEGRITEAAVALLEARVGIAVRVTTPGWHLASRDVMCNYGRAMGDTNPLYRSTEYASATRWGRLIAQPTFLRYCGTADPADPTADQVYQGGRGDPIAGVHGYLSGVELHWLRHVHVGDLITVRGGLSDVQLKRSSMAGTAVHETHDKVYTNQRGEPIGVTRDLVIRIERRHSRSRAKHRGLDVPHHYSDDELRQIEAEYAAEYVRGAKPRYFEDVAVGETSSPLIKGPFTTSTYVCFMMGLPLSRSKFHFAHSELYQRRGAHPKAFPVNELGIPESVARVHVDRDMARRAGLPETFDAGAERVAGVSHAFTNWMGDDGFLRRLRLRVRGFVFVGDLYRVVLKVTQKEVTRNGGLVRLEIDGRNQRGEAVVQGDGDVLLPSRELGPVIVPIEPDRPTSIFEPR